MINHTKHAKVRARQRGIPPFVVLLLNEFGERIHDGRGGVRVFFSRRSIRRMERAFGRRPVAKFSEYLGSYMVLSNDDNTVITIGHRLKRMRRN